MRQQIDRVAGAENRRDVAQQQRRVGDVAARGVDGHGFARVRQHVVALRGDPPFVVAVADGAARGDRAVVVDDAVGDVAARGPRRAP